MLKKFQKLIYKNLSEKEKVRSECLDFITHRYKNYSIDEILKFIDSNTSNEIADDYFFALMQTEGQMLFDIAVKKYGLAIWNGKAWKNKKCKRKCPFGDECRKYLIQIDNKKFCYGQLYKNNITQNQIIKLLKSCQVKILFPDEKIYLDLNKKYDKQLLDSFFSEFDQFIDWFGDGKNKVYGYNVIQFL